VESLVFGDYFGDDFLFDSICGLDFYGLLLLRGLDNFLSVFFDRRHPLGFGDHFFQRTFFWLINLA
jgi:hypothetical protein